ncbi:hypothetical protein ElyMa_006380300 [Elysia marginata]|uniref:Uncharacterized protein n=1 Tax=Elysia marginata TaxID=1093978 RepID=A0AAV4HPQ6_9GAST|nr:hypothetical protein ElyMa_006380300 [Elysia marginata]
MQQAASLSVETRRVKEGAARLEGGICHCIIVALFPVAVPDKNRAQYDHSLNPHCKNTIQQNAARMKREASGQRAELLGVISLSFWTCIPKLFTHSPQ